MKNDAIIIYAKWPELNKTKTRIAEETTPEFARDISMACLDDVVSHIAFSPEYDVYFGVNTEQELYNFKEKYNIPSIITTHDPVAYGENEQSSRMFSAFSKLFNYHNLSCENLIQSNFYRHKILARWQITAIVINIVLTG